MNFKRLPTKGIVLVFILLLIQSVSGQEASKQFELKNNIKVYLLERHSMPLLHMVVAFNHGSKNETTKNSGISHLLEHYILFRGTRLRSGKQVSQDIRKHGGRFNAHTGIDITTFELSLPSEFSDFALQNQKELLFDMKFNEEEIEKEKDIIEEEINQIKDDHIRYGQSLMLQQLFSGHPYENPVYGNKDIIKSITTGQLENYSKKYFVPENCAITIVGDFSIEEMEKKIRKTFGDIPVTDFKKEDFPNSVPLKKSIDITHEMDVQKAYMLIGTIAPDYNHADQNPMEVLTHILGRGVNPLLNSALYGRRILADSYAMGYSSFQKGGIFSVQITLDPKNISAAKRAVLKFFKKCSQFNYSSSDYYEKSHLDALGLLESAKNKLRFSFYQSQENGLNIAWALARYLLLNEIPERESYLDLLDKTSSSNMRKMAGDYLGKGKYAVIVIKPKKK